MRILSDWKYVPDTDPFLNTQAIIGMSFGANRKATGEHPGVSNEEIARIIHRLWLAKNLPVIAQREVAEVMARLNLPIRPELVVSEKDNQFHINSHEVLRQAWNCCRALNIRRVVIVAHPAHILRCAAVARKMGFTVRLPHVSSVPYEPRSRQWWTRNRFSFFFWELYARIGGKLKVYL